MKQTSSRQVWLVGIHITYHEHITKLRPFLLKSVSLAQTSKSLNIFRFEYSQHLKLVVVLLLIAQLTSFSRTDRQTFPIVHAELDTHTLCEKRL